MINDLKPLILNLSSFAKKRMGFARPPRLFLKKDEINRDKTLGKTAYYDPGKESVTIFISGRHPKDILRSFAHELVHHCQNLRGDLSQDKITNLTKNYAQDCDHMRNMEKEAYLQGNMCFRDWEDSLQDKDLYKIKLAEVKFLKENKDITKNLKEDTKVSKLTREKLKETIIKILEGELPAGLKAWQDKQKSKKAPGQRDDGSDSGDDDEPIQGSPNPPPNDDEAQESGEAPKNGEAQESGEEVAEEPPADDDGDEPVLNESWTPEAENLLYEKRFTPRNNRLFSALVEKWIK